MHTLLPQVSLMILRQPGKFIRSCWDNLLEASEKDILLSSSPEFNPLDKIVWGVFGLHVNKTSDNNAAFLMQKIMEMMGSLDRNTMAKACRQFWSMVEAMVVDDGNFFR